MGDVSTPYDLEPLKEPLIESVINAYMAKNVKGTGGLEFDEGSCKKGEFRFRADAGGLLDGDTKIYCSYPDGQWREDETWARDSKLGPEDSPMFGVSLFDAKAKFAEIREAVSAWVDPWIGCQSPNVFNNQIASMARIIDLLYVQDEVRVNGNPVETGGSQGSASAPASSVRACIADMSSQLSSLNGLAIDALEQAYVNDVGLTISGQRALAAVAGLAIAGEAEAWNQAYANLKEFFAKATADFNGFAGTSDGSGKGGETALTIVSTVAGAASACTFAFPPAATTLGVVSGLAAVGAAFWPSEEATDFDTLVLKGESFDAMWESFKTSVRAVDEELSAAERALATMCRNAKSDLWSHPDSYSITAKGGAGKKAQPNDDLNRFLDTDQGSAARELYWGDRISIVHAKLKKVAGMIEHVGDHQRSVAGKLGGTDAAGNPSAQVANEWTRESLHGGPIGWGSTGHLAEFSSLVDTLVDLLIDESKTAHRVAQHCLDVSTEFRLTDDEIETGLDRLASRLS